MPTTAHSDSDSASELSGKADSPAAAVGGGDESLAEEQDGDEVEEEEAVEEEVKEEEEDSEEDGEEDEADEEVVEEEDMEEDMEEDVEEVVEEEEEEGEEDAQEEDDKEEEGEEDGQEVVEEEEEEGEEDGQEEDVDMSEKDTKDASEKIESEEHVEGPKSLSLIPEGSISKLTAITHTGNGSLTSYDPSDVTECKPHLEMETPSKASKDVNEDHNSLAHSILGDSMGGENTRSDHENDKAMENKNMESDGVAEKEDPVLHTKIDLQAQEDSSLSSKRTPQRRLRSSSPDVIDENANKKPAIICDFFARGWCIKGNSCRFLHQKEGAINTSQQTKEDLAGTSTKGDFLDDKGSREEAERSNLSASKELLDSSNIDSSAKAPLFLQRALVRAYGEESHGLPKFQDDFSMHGAQNAGGEEFLKVPQSGRASNPPMSEFRQTLIREEFENPFGVAPHFNTVDERQPAGDDFLSRRFLNEGKQHQEMPRGESLNDSPFTKGPPLIRNALVPEYGYYSGASSTASSLYQNRNTALAYDKRTVDPSTQNQTSHFVPHGSYTSYSLTSSLNSGFNNPLQPGRISSPVHVFGQSGTSPTHISTRSSAEFLGTHKMSDFGKGNYGSRSVSLPRSASPLYSRTEAENAAQHNLPRDAWEPSVPFRSSYVYAPANISSSASQYDPLLDSIEHPSAGNSTYQTSQRTDIHNVSSHHINSDPILSGIHTAGYNAQKPLNYFPQSDEDISGKNTSAHGLSMSTTVVALSGPRTVEGNNSVAKEEKNWNSDIVVDGAIVSEADPGGNMRNIEDKGRNNRESKALKFFRSALVDFVKELVKPSWREGHLSKDAHKMIVKKAVEKVLSALQPHQVPGTAELVNQYLSTSRPKLLKLVEGYVDKYTKSGAS